MASGRTPPPSFHPAPGNPIPVGILPGVSSPARPGSWSGCPPLRLSGRLPRHRDARVRRGSPAVPIHWESLTGGAGGDRGDSADGRVILSGRATGGSPRIDRAAKQPVHQPWRCLSDPSPLHDPGRSPSSFASPAPGRPARTRPIRLDESAAAAPGSPSRTTRCWPSPRSAALRIRGALSHTLRRSVSPGDFTYHRAVEILVFAVFGGSEHNLRSRLRRGLPSPPSPKRFVRSATTGTSSTDPARGDDGLPAAGGDRPRAVTTVPDGPARRRTRERPPFLRDIGKWFGGLSAPFPTSSFGRPTGGNRRSHRPNGAGRRRFST